ncbi:MAG: hypothetical protein GX096_02630 [Clostridiales bacterium]|nr:hypothetical protein [Clostridiales bacterium]
MRKALSDALQGAPWLSAMARVFEEVDAPLYIVGGAARNPLMGLPISDVDICGPLRPEQVMSLCEGTDVHAVLRAAHFGTVELHLADAEGKHQMAEYTTFREDSYRCGHKPDSVKFTTDIAVDALRRDFSVNAMYRRVYPDHLGDVIDPTGGLVHLAQGVLHTTTPDPDQVLKDDGLRILRAARFQAELDLVPSDELMASLAKYAHLLRDIIPQRLGEEVKKIMLADLRYPMLRRRTPATASGLRTIHEIGAWDFLFGGAAYDERSVEALAGLMGGDGDSEAKENREAGHGKAAGGEEKENGEAGHDKAAGGEEKENSEAGHGKAAGGEEKENSEAGGEENRDSEAKENSEAGERFALLLRGVQEEMLEPTLRFLSVSIKDVQQATLLHRALNQIKEHELSLFGGAVLGIDALLFAQRAFAALGEAELSNAAHSMIADLAQKPLSLKELAINGRDLLPIYARYSAPQSSMGSVLQDLWRLTIDQSLPNQKADLLLASDQMIKNLVTM